VEQKPEHIEKFKEMLLCEEVQWADVEGAERNLDEHMAICLWRHLRSKNEGV
jgi:hypothetical protein